MKHVSGRLAVTMAAVLSLSACAPAVLAPTVPVAPAQGKPFDQFASDQAACQAYANQQVAPLTAQANNNAVGSALLGTALGAGLGAAIGGGRGAAIGAASGAALGTGVGVQNSSMAGMSIQQQFNMYYAQCMSARGNTVPGMSPAPAPGGYGPGGYGPGGYGPGTPVPPPPPHY